MSDQPPRRADYAWHCDMPTRWMDNDIYGHVNNVTYYSYFDTIANRYLIEAGGLDIQHSPVVGFVVESHCYYHAPVAFPECLEAALRVERLGQRSVTYGIAILKADADYVSAHGQFVHVFVDRQSQRSQPIPEPIRLALDAIRLPQP